MNCEDFKRELEAAVENRVAPDFSEAREHLRHCERCRALSEDYHIIERAVEEWAAIDETPDLSGRVVAVLSNDREPNRSAQPAISRSRIIPVLAGLCAVAVLFLAFALVPRPGQNPPRLGGGTEPTVFNDPDTPPVEDAPLIDDTPPIEMEHLWGDTIGAYESFVQQVTAPFESLMDGDDSSTPDQEDSVPPGAKQHGAIGSVPQQIAGLRSDFRKSLGFLTAAFPSRSTEP